MISSGWGGFRPRFNCEKPPSVMSLDTLVEAAMFLESSGKGTSRDDSAIARGKVE